MSLELGFAVFIKNRKALSTDETVTVDGLDDEFQGIYTSLLLLRFD